MPYKNQNSVLLGCMQTDQLGSALDHFPMEHRRPAQISALEFITDAVERGMTDIIIGAPTGVGKTAIGAAACFWASSYDVADHIAGGYQLVTQKMLQDQLEHDFPRYLPQFRNRAASLKSAVEYPCSKWGTCMAGRLAGAKDKNQKCAQRHPQARTCPYLLARASFNMADMAITNYSYIFTEHLHVGELGPRNMLVCDEAHTLDHQITGFVEVMVDKEMLDNWAPGVRPVPQMETVEEFTSWLRHTYMVAGTERMQMLAENLAENPGNQKMQTEYDRLKNHLSRIEYAIDQIDTDPAEWVYWQERVAGEWTSIAKPLSAAPFVPSMINEMGATRVYMSAYVGPKDVFCRTLGLAPDTTAWLELDSAFPADQRAIHFTTVGSMGRASVDQTLPKMLKMCATIMTAHPAEKGVIHSHTYALGKQVFDHLSKTGHGSRLLFAANAAERTTLFNRHKTSSAPTVLISPSMTEGYSFDDSLARFQLIAKCLSQDTRILTRSGLKSYTEITAEDEAFCLDLAGNGVWSPIQAVVVKHYVGAMLEVKNTSSSMCVTPDHRVLVRSCKNFSKRALKYVLASDPALFSAGYACPVKPDSYTGKTLPSVFSLSPYVQDGDLLALTSPTVRTPCNYIPTLRHTPGTATWLFTGKENIELVRKIGHVRFKGRMKCVLTPLEYNTGDFMELVGWYIAEGFLYGTDSSKGVALTQIKKVGVKRISQLLTRLKMHWTYHGKDFKIKSDLLYRFCKLEIPFGSKNKLIPGWMLDLDAELLKRLLTGLMSGDGHQTKSGTKIYYTSSKTLAVNVCELALKVGYSPALYTTKRGAYAVTLQNRAYQTFKREYARWINYAGPVWCVNTVHSNFMAERDGKFFFTGNCPFPYLGDRQVKARMENDRDWFTLQTIMTVLQTCGRLVRNEKDFGQTYVLDSDIVRLFDENDKFLPAWFKAAFRFY